MALRLLFPVLFVVNNAEMISALICKFKHVFLCFSNKKRIIILNERIFKR